MINEELHLRLRCAIVEHVNASGPFHLEQVRARFPEVSEETFWDLARGVRARHFTAPGAWPEACARSPEDGGRNRPPPVPEWATSPDFNRNLMAEQIRLFGDAELLRASALDSKGRVRDRSGFVQSMKIREELLKSGLEMQRVACDIGKAKMYLNELGQIIAEHSPAIREQMRARIAALNDHYLFSRPSHAAQVAARSRSTS